MNQSEKILSALDKAGERLFENSYVRTSDVSAHGDRVDVGFFDAQGLHVNHWHDHPDSNVGVSSARKLEMNLEPGNLEPIESLPEALDVLVLSYRINGRIYRLEEES